MKKIVLLVIVGIFVHVSIYAQRENRYDTPQKITVAGKIDNHTPDRYVTLWVHRIGFEREQILTKPDGDGHFVATFESYIPLDVWVDFNFALLLHPGDSLFVQFDGKSNHLSDIKYSGNSAKTNSDYIKFEQMFSENYNLGNVLNAVTKYGAEQYLQFLDTLQRNGQRVYNQFVSENMPNEESKKLAQLRIKGDFYNKLFMYMTYRKFFNTLDFWDLLENFYEGGFINRLSVDPSMFIGSSTLSDLFQIAEKYISKITGNNRRNYISNTIEFIPDPLLRQILLSRHFHNHFDISSNITDYERFRDTLDIYLKEPFIKEPLHQKYLQVKLSKDNPQVYTEVILKEVANLSIKQVIDDLLQQNKGKVIYIDFWGTWCAPCLAEMPNSKVIEHELKDKDVAFIYICLESKEEQWKATVDKFELGGQHLLLSGKQNSEIRKLFGIVGVPFYILIDKNGVIKEKGNHLRPLTARDKIKEML